MTIGVDSLGAERERLLKAGIAAGTIEPAEHFFILRLNDPDRGLVVLASGKNK